ncbi:MAG: hypothetical protein A2889_07870 [Nitrospinae bacterium RIFCSPLOWO2_01_FULL_39_10]|nr:MAG: hypothetical protein A2889_07870 [Nitrospinae bacterium RIFCSPLOWO2_01_FULL_39_10]
MKEPLHFLTDGVFIMEMPNRYVYLMFQIDTNRLNSRQNLPFMNKLEQWHKNGVIDIEISEVAQHEARYGNNSLRNQKAMRYIFSETKSTTDDEIKMLEEIKSILFPNGPKNQNENNDIEIVFNAWKYSRILVTNDGASNKQPNGILGNLDKLRTLGIRVVRDNEAVSMVEQKIRERDNMVRMISEKYHKPLPNWIGKE